MKKTKILLYLFFTCLPAIIFSQTQYVGDFISFTIEAGKICVVEMNPADASVKTNEYSGIMIENEPLSVFQCRDGLKFFILKSEDIAIIYDEESMPLFWGAGKNKYKNTERFLLGDTEYSSTSELIENGKIYSAENLGNFILDNLWCEAESDAGINVTIDLGTCGTGLLISNGYVSEKMYLFDYNNRVKQIELTDVNDSTYSQIITLEDTAMPQFIKIDNHPGRHIVLTIKDVYQGSKWNDTCINFILKIL